MRFQFFGCFNGAVELAPRAAEYPVGERLDSPVSPEVGGSTELK